MIENMNNMEDIMTKMYDSFNAFTNRPIIMVDNATIFTYGSILITTTILAVATIYDEEGDDGDDNVDEEEEEEEEEPNNPINLFANTMGLSTNEMSPSTNQMSPSTNEIKDKEETNQNVGGKKHKKRKRTIKKHKN